MNEFEQKRNGLKTLGLLGLGLLTSCTSRRVYRPPGNYTPGPSQKSYHSYSESRIVSRGIFSSTQMARYFLTKNSRAKYQSVDYIARLYIHEASVEGINHDIAFAQMCHETNFLRYGNQVQHWQHNYCGLGATDDGRKGLSFPDAATGVRAHIQHLKAYGSTYPLRNRLVDPRFKYVKRGSAPTIDHLAGTWASDRNYAAHLRKHLSAINTTAVT
ncbi:MAG: glucosaminidase domain-containing protein [Lentisphaeraceae bacterium]|nr:glucosaminidase domain-containing protein [Lentisphaeraceae bacterium]